MPVGIAETYYRKILDNEAFIVSESFTITDGGTANIHLKNPADSGKTIVLVSVTVGGDGDFKAVTHDEFSSNPSGGTAAEIQAALLDSGGADDNGVADANRNVSFTNGEATFSVLGGGQGTNSVGGVSGLPTLAIEESREVVLEIENTTTAEHQYAGTIIYFEKND